MPGVEGSRITGQIFKKSCAYCGDIVRMAAPGAWRYKKKIYNVGKTKTTKNYYFCSWTCYRKAEATKEIERWKRPIE